MAITKFLDPQNDYAFKRIFGTEKNKDILIHFLNDMLKFRTHAKIKDVRFLKPIQDPVILAKKTSTVDILCTDDQKHQYIVEMQVAPRAGFTKRAQYYAAKAYSTQANEGQKYSTLKEIVFLAVTNFVMFPEHKDYKSDHVILERTTHEHYLKDFSFTFLELPKFKKDIDHLSSMVEKWTYFFKHAKNTSPEKLAKLIQQNGVIFERAYEELNRFYWTEAELRTYDQAAKNKMDEIAVIDAAEEKGRAEGRVEGEKIGEAKGKLAEKQAIAKNLLAQNAAWDVVTKITGLNEEEIQMLVVEEIMEG